MQKVGMKFEGVLREEVFVKGSFWDMKLYSILIEEFYQSLKKEDEGCFMKG
jgi:ribosomal-protein-alanine N-acetyltransferase